jgi:hypothetical protein
MKKAPVEGATGAWGLPRWAVRGGDPSATPEQRRNYNLVPAVKPWLLGYFFEGKKAPAATGSGANHSVDVVDELGDRM